MKLSLFECSYISLFFLSVPLVGEYCTGSAFYIPYCYSIIGLLGICIITIRRNINVSLVDILLGSCLLYNLSNIIESDSLPVICLFILIYLLTKRAFQKKKAIHILINTLIISGGIQVLICLLQLLGYWDSNNSYFQVTGTFDNPGLLGGYLSICLVAALGQNKDMNKWLRRIFIILLAVGIVLSDSRAAWCGVLVVLLYRLMKYLKLGLYKRVMFFILLGIFVAVISLFIYKSPSANGRLTIWKVCVMMIKDRPVLGYGYASFSHYYMHYQTEYIRKNRQTQQIKLLSDNKYAFNELLHIACEQGVVGLLLAMSVVVYLVKEQTKTPTQHPLFLCFLAYLVFSCFSYPCDDFMMLMLLAFILGGLSATVSFVVNLRSRYFKWGGYILGFLTVVTLSKGFVSKLCIERALTGFIYRDEYENLDYLQDNFLSFQNSRELIFQYARTLYLKGEYKVGIPVLKQAIKLYPTTDKYCDLGEMYQETGEVEKAERCYKYASQMSPYLVYPQYCLFLIYRDMGREMEAWQIALQIKDLCPKVENQIVCDIKLEIKKYLDDKSTFKNSHIDK